LALTAQPQSSEAHKDTDGNDFMTIARRHLLVEGLEEHLKVVKQLELALELLSDVADCMCRTLQSGHMVFWCGNGGSAADCQHLAAELVGRFRKERKGLASIALTTDSSVLTSIGNDYGYDYVFARQVEALCRPGDLLVGISTSGNSSNVCAAISKARDIGAYTFAMTGEGGGRLATLADVCLQVPSSHTARVQESHILAGHLLCDLIEMHIDETRISDSN
jgi:D-sedoheptulose 7-phosphate isomerase